MKEKYLPIGTVVTLKDATKKIMVIGYCPVENGHNQMYDYSACLYPEGVIDSNKILLFNHDQIATIHFEGYVSDEFQKSNEQIKQLVSSSSNIKPLSNDSQAEDLNIERNKNEF